MKHSVLRRLSAVACLSLGLIGLAGAQPVTLAVDSTLHEEPRADARALAQLKSGASGEMIGRQGAWIQLKTPAGSGWVMSFNVRFESGSQSAAGSGSGSGVVRLLTPRQKPATTATIGIRGLEEEDLRRASVDMQQLQLLDRYGASRNDAASAAQASGLEPATVEYLAK